MGSISNIGDEVALDEHLRGLTDAEVLAHELVQQGAIHAIGTLMTSGCTEANATQMLASLREYAAVIRKERARRGIPLFEKDQTGFQ